MSTGDNNLTWHPHKVTRADRERLSGHQGCVVWFTGLSGSGKSTVANEVDYRLSQLGVHSFVLDGDNIRLGLNANLGFSAADREENIRRVGHVAELFASAGIIVLTAFVSPYRKDREAVRALVDGKGRPGDFVEVHVQASREVCELRDPKGLYKKAREGQIANFTGISDPYEAPESPQVLLDSNHQPVDALAEQVIEYLRHTGKIVTAADRVAPRRAE